MNGQVESMEDTKGKNKLRRYKLYFAFGGICIPNDRHHKIYSWSAGVLILVAIFQMLYSVHYFRDDSSALLFQHTLLGFSAIFCAVYCFLERKALRATVAGMKPYLYQSQLVSKFATELEVERVKNLIFSFKLAIASHMMSIIVLQGGGILDAYLKNLDYVLMYPCWFPFDITYRPYNVLAFLWQHLLANITASTIFGWLALVILVYSELTNQLSTLQFAVEHINERAVEWALKDNIVEGEDQRKKLEAYDSRLKQGYIISTRMCAQHHSQIIQYYKIADGIFRTTYSLALTVGFLALVSTGFILISDNQSLKMKAMFAAIFELVYLFVVCWFGEHMADKSENLRLVIYGVNWYDMPKECQSTLRLMMERTLQPLQLTAHSGLKINLDTYMSVVKASYSYFNMMLAIGES